MKKAILYKKLEGKKVQCEVCNHKCVIAPKKRGVCGVRENKDGDLYSLVYGKLIAEHVDPIEKKPFFHFLPGSNSLSIATLGCNFRCENCQNWDISQGPKLNGKVFGEAIAPEKIIKDTLDNHCKSIAYTYTEPTVFIEYALDVMKLAKKKDLKNIWVTNGYMTKKALKLILPYLDAANVDLKAFDNKTYLKLCGAKLDPILENLKEMKKNGIWLEVTTLVIPGISDSEKMFKDIAKFIKNKLSKDTPWHVSSFSPDISWKLQNIPLTPIESLIKARDIGIKEGLEYVYTGNTPGEDGENTYCPSCKELVIERFGYAVKRFDKNGKCSKCGYNIGLQE